MLFGPSSRQACWANVYANNSNPLLVISGVAGVGFKDCAVLDADAACGEFLESLGCLLEEIMSEIFSRRIQVRERLKVVDHLVIQAIDNRAQQVLEQLEVEQKAGLIQMLPGEGNQHAVVVAVRVLTLAVVVAQVVSRRKTRLYGNFEHK